MIGYLTANGKSSADFNVYLSGDGTYGIAERDVEQTSIPGRSGDLLIDNGRYKNVSHAYKCVIRGDFAKNFSGFLGYLQAQRGYIRLEDSFHPDEYVLGRFTGETHPKRMTRDVMGSFEITFSRKPQRYLKAGEEPLPEFTTNGQIFSEMYTESLPLVRVYGTGAVGIGDNTITINSLTSGATYTDIDCDTQNAFYGTTNCNDKITLNSGEFFSLKPGANGISLGNGVSRVIVTPRWWKL